MEREKITYEDEKVSKKSVDPKFKSIHIDLDKGIYEINGNSAEGLPITDLKLVFDGTWKLSFTQEFIDCHNMRN